MSSGSLAGVFRLGWSVEARANGLAQSRVMTSWHKMYDFVYPSWLGLKMLWHKPCKFHILWYNQSLSPVRAGAAHQRASQVSNSERQKGRIQVKGKDGGNAGKRAVAGTLRMAGAWSEPAERVLRVLRARSVLRDGEGRLVETPDDLC